MASTYCRLCLSRENVLDVFSKELINSEQLRMYIRLCSGVNILATDIITKHVCHTCCEISMKIYKFRKNAMANDISLKRLLHQTQKYGGDPTNSNVLTVNEFLVKKPNIKIELESHMVASSPTPKQHKQYVIHPSIFKLMKYHPKAVLPSDLITTNCDPKVHIVNLDSAKSELKNMPIKLPSDMKLLEMKFPGSTTNIKKNSDPSHTETKTNIAEKSNIGKRANNGKATEKDTQQRSNPIQKKTNIQEKDQIISKICLLEIEKDTLLEGSSIKRSLPVEEENRVKRIKVVADIAIPSISKPDTNELPRSEKCIPHESNNNCGTSNENVIPCHDTIQTNTTSQVMATEEVQQQSQNIMPEESEVCGEDRKNSLHRKSRPSFFIDDDMYNSDDDYVVDHSENNPYSLLETIEEQTTYTCNTCNKMFDKKRNLKSHRQRMHKTCVVCKKMFKAQSSLISHMKETCYNTIIKNQPVLCLKKCDDMLEKISNASDSDFEVFYISDDDEQRLTNEDQTIISQEEREKISTLYNKYHNAFPSFYKSVACQEDVELFTVTMGKGQATLTNMYPILKYYRVPTSLHSGDSMNVEVSDEPEESNSTYQMCDWAGCSVTTLKSLMTHTKTVDGRHIVPKPNTPVVQNVPISNQLLKEALQTQPKPITTTPNTPPIILNTLPFRNVQHLQRPSTLSDNVFQLQIPKPPTLQQNICSSPQVIYNVNSPITVRTNPTITEINSIPHPQNQYTQSIHPVATHTIVPQTRTLTTNPSTIVVQQAPVIMPHRTYIQTSQGYILSTNPTITTSNLQNIPSNLNPAVTSNINHINYIPTTPNTAMPVASANQAVLRTSDLNRLPPSNVIVIPSNPSTQKPQSVHTKPMNPNFPKYPPIQKNFPSKTDQNSPCQSNSNVTVKPVVVNGASPKYVESTSTSRSSTSTNPPDGKLGYLRVKAPWELK